MKIVSWNINGLRSQKNNIAKILDELNADILCLQETKVTRDLLEEQLALVENYSSYFSFSRKRSGYSGVATFCKKGVAPCYAQEGLGGTLNVGSLSEDAGSIVFLSDSWDPKKLKDLDYEGRCMITQHQFVNEDGCEKLLSIINVYCPRADPNRPERGDYKISFYRLLKERSAALKLSGSAVIILGDVNTSHRRIDHCEPDDDVEFEKRPGRLFLDNFFISISKENNELGRKLEEQNSKGSENISLNKAYLNTIGRAHSLYEEFKVVDTFRYFYPCREGAFTCWNTQVGARATNYGTRIDYVLCDLTFLPYIKDSNISQQYKGSDHCPVYITTQNIVVIPSAILPTICTKFYPEFYGNQQKLSSYFVTASSTDKLSNLSKDIETFSEKNSKPSKRKGVAEKQSTRPISSFFLQRNKSEKEHNQNKRTATEPTGGSLDYGSSETNSKINLGSLMVSNSSDVNSVVESKSAPCFAIPESKPKTSGWNFLMKGLPPAPLCSGHNEATVLRTVKKKGPNYNKQFYACVRGLGKEGDPNGRCNFFQWLSR